MFDGAGAVEAVIVMDAGPLFGDTPTADGDHDLGDTLDTHVEAGWATRDEPGATTREQVATDAEPAHLLALPGEALPEASRALFDSAMARVDALLTGLPERADYRELLDQTFGNAGADPAEFQARADTLAAGLRGGGLKVEVELRGAEDLGGAHAAYAAVGHTGAERIYVNADWVATLHDPAPLVGALAAEYGHALDERLNPGLDSRGDEGEAFAAQLVRGTSLSEAERAHYAELNDWTVLDIDGVPVVAQLEAGDNTAPVLDVALVDDTATAGLPWVYTVPTDSFHDPEGAALDYTATLATGDALPGWLAFEPGSARFSGVPPVGTGTVSVRVTASDPAGLSTFDDFDLAVSTTLDGAPVAAVGFLQVYELVDAAEHSSSGYYQEETNRFTTAASSLAGSHFTFFQPGSETFTGTDGNNVAGYLSYIDADGTLQSIQGVISRVVKASGNKVEGYYFWVNAQTADVGDDRAYVLTVGESYFQGGVTYATSSDRADRALNDYFESPTVSVSDASALEASGSIEFTVTRSSDAGSASVAWATFIREADTASVGDFVGASGTVSFAAGETSKTVTVTLIDDQRLEADETFAVTLANPSTGLRLGTSTATGTILDDDAAPVFSVADAATLEGDVAVFTVTRTGDAQMAQAVAWYTSLELLDTASAGDLTLAEGVLSFAPGETSKTFSVQTTEDSLLEDNETFTVGLRDATGGAVVSDTQGSARGTIEDDEAAILYSVSPASVQEGGVLSFTISRSGDVGGSQSIDYATSIGAGDTASAGDFTAASGTVTFLQGELSRTVFVQTTQDALFEGDETLTVTLSNLQSHGSTRISTSAGSARGTILDDDAAPVFSVAAASGVEGRDITFTVSRSGDAQATQTVAYGTLTAAGDDAPVGDFSVTSGTLAFAQGETSRTFTVSTTDNTRQDGDRSFSVTLDQPGGGAVLDPGARQARGTILDDDGVFTEDGPALGLVPEREPLPADRTYQGLQLRFAPGTVLDGASEQLRIEGASGLDNGIPLDGSVAGGSFSLGGTTYGFTVATALGTRTLTLTPAAAVDHAAMDGLLAALRYVDTDQDPDGRAQRVFELSVAPSEGAPIGIDTLKVTVVPVNDAPVVDLDVGAAGLDRSATFTANGAPVRFGEAALANLGDVDGSTLTWLRVDVDRITLESGDRLVLGQSGNAVHIDLGTALGAPALTSGTVTVGGRVFGWSIADAGGSRTVTFASHDAAGSLEQAAPLADYEALLDTLGFDNGSQAFTDGGSRVFGVTVDDGLLASAVARLTVTLAAGTDDRGITVTGLADMSEGSDAVFVVELDTPSTTSTLIALTLGADADTASPGTDYDGEFTAHWVDDQGAKHALELDAQGRITLPAGVTTFYVEVRTVDDHPAVYEGGETLTLKAAIVDGNEGSDSSTIVDDGTGRRYDEQGEEKPGTQADPFTADDDRPTLAVTGRDDVSEGSPAVFTVSLSNAVGSATEIALSLADLTTNSQDPGSPIDHDPGFTAYYVDGDGARQTLSVVDGRVLLPGGVTSFQVVVQTNDDSEFEGPESFTLTAAFTAPALQYADTTGGTERPGASATGSSTLLDDGAGRVYDQTGGDTNEGKQPGDPGYTPPDDDRAIGVEGRDDVSEGSDTVFRVKLEAPSPASTLIALTLGAAADTASPGTDYDGDITAYWFDDQGAKYALDVDAQGRVTLPAGVTLFYVKVTTLDDDPAVYEGGETLTLKAAIVNGNEGSDSSTIVDDGHGTRCNDQGVQKPATQADPFSADDDRPTLTVTGRDDVAEGTPAVFTVSLSNAVAATTEIALSLADVTTDSDASSSPLDYSAAFTAYYVDDEGGQQALPVTNGRILLPGGVTDFQVVVQTTDDSEVEGPESFSLTAAFTAPALKYANGVDGVEREGASQGAEATLLDDDSPAGNAAPVIAGGEDRAALTETDTTLTAKGRFTVSDADAGDTLSVAVSGVAVTGGSFAGTLPSALTEAALKAMLSLETDTLVTPSGINRVAVDWTFTSGASGDLAFDFLREGETLEFTYSLRASDDSGSNNDSATTTVTVTITGTNDSPTLGGSPGASVLERNEGLKLEGVMRVTDIDLSDTVSVSLQALDVTQTKAASGTTLPAALAQNGYALLKAMMRLETVDPSESPTALRADPAPGAASGSAVKWVFDSGDQAFDFLRGNEVLTLSYRVTARDDSGATRGESPDAAPSNNRIVITITGTNDIPRIEQGSVATAVTRQDQPRVLATTDFGRLLDPDSSLSAVVVTVLPDRGQLQLKRGADWVAVNAGASISVGDIAEGRLRYLPRPGEVGANAQATMRFAVSDGFDRSVNDYALGIRVDPLAPGLRPTSTPDTLTINQGSPTLLTRSDFGTYRSTSNTPWAGVTIESLPAKGTLQVLDGGVWKAVSPGRYVSLATLDGGGLRYVPATGAGEFGTGYASVGFRVVDSGSPGVEVAQSESIYALRVDVLQAIKRVEVMDGSLGVQRGTTTALGMATFNAMDRGISAVRIASLPSTATGTLQWLDGKTNKWVAVKGGQTLARSDIEAGKLRFVAKKAAATTAFNFSLFDGAQFSATAKVTVSVTAVEPAQLSVPDASREPATVKLVPELELPGLPPMGLVAEAGAPEARLPAGEPPRALGRDSLSAKLRAAGARASLLQGVTLAAAPERTAAAPGQPA